MDADTVSACPLVNFIVAMNATKIQGNEITVALPYFTFVPIWLSIRYHMIHMTLFLGRPRTTYVAERPTILTLFLFSSSS